MLECSVEGCFLDVVAKSFCNTHYKRFKRHGDPLKGRPDTWGSTLKHPLWNSYQWFKRKHRLCDEWLDFWVFVKDVGDKPDNTCIRRKDFSKNLSPSNYYFKITYPCKDKAEYARQWRKANPDRVKNSDLKNSFGIDLATYNKILKQQSNVCAICKKEDPFYKNLAVDHCHNTKKIRGLLCHQCNKGLGCFGDDFNVLSNAIKYLELNN